jgi:hypothetical protein
MYYMYALGVLTLKFAETQLFGKMTFFGASEKRVVLHKAHHLMLAQVKDGVLEKGRMAEAARTFSVHHSTMTKFWRPFTFMLSMHNVTLRCAEINAIGISI